MHSQSRGLFWQMDRGFYIYMVRMKKNNDLCQTAVKLKLSPILSTCCCYVNHAVTKHLTCRIFLHQPAACCSLLALGLNGYTTRTSVETIKPSVFRKHTEHAWTGPGCHQLEGTRSGIKQTYRSELFKNILDAGMFCSSCFLFAC